MTEGLLSGYSKCTLIKLVCISGLQITLLNTQKTLWSHKVQNRLTKIAFFMSFYPELDLPVRTTDLYKNKCI